MVAIVNCGAPVRGSVIAFINDAMLTRFYTVYYHTRSKLGVATTA